MRCGGVGCREKKGISEDNKNFLYLVEYRVVYNGEYIST